MIDLVYTTLLTIINKENNGYVSPTEFRVLANNVQSEIFREYFEDENRDKVKRNRGLTHKGIANLDKNVRQRIAPFFSFSKITKDSTTSMFHLPVDLYHIEDDGVLTSSGKVIEEVEKHIIGYLEQSMSKASKTYPLYEQFGNKLKVMPDWIDDIEVRYIRTPKIPNWTYITIAGKEKFDPTNPSYQDFELHPSEFSNIVLRMLSFFGINLREEKVVQIAESLKDKMNIKDNN